MTWTLAEFAERCAECGADVIPAVDPILDPLLPSVAYALYRCAWCRRCWRSTYLDVVPPGAMP